MGTRHSLVRLLAKWAAQTDAVAALWLFGSRAKGTSRPDSDYDQLRPKITDNHDGAFGDFVSQGDNWKAQLRDIVRCDVSLVGFRDDLPGRFDPRIGGV